MSVRRLIQFTDPHLYGDETATLRGVATYPGLLAALEHAQGHDSPADALLVTGDLVQDDPAGYALFRRTFAASAAPVLCLPGNHDIPSAMRRELASHPFVLAGPVDLDEWRIVLLDSTVPGCAGGRLSERSLAELDAALRGASARHALVCLHHHPIPMSSRWLDQVALANPADLFRVIDAHRNVRAVVWGHVHQRFEGLHRRVRLLGTPSTCSQFLPRSDEFAIDASPPAYRTLELHPDGTLRTEVVWVDAGSGRACGSVCSAA